MITGRAALRLECLKLAVQRQGANDPRPVPASTQPATRRALPPSS
jgi:hypothetical protein